ncbi:hypothetical protein TRFO_05008 [Tritrichomonas foetus]|uniref:Uncharacterized protein n=1 Tax=Tritrichomonas foetus TaxID=1144522 RepID=A0A1J4KAG7_9EUKA|nr:hypothetical protein TRFO_05008 [Tritrichomonas foetus]|eukprot:OHT07904.1 hypothetical protein TRFO_05008 [Tritrichomonas foetus]
MSNEIITQIKKYQQFSYLKATNYPTSITTKIYNTYLKNLRLLRATFHMEMLIADKNHLFIIPPFVELFKDIFSEPNKIMFFYPSMFNQKVAYIISSIYEKPQEFAKIVVTFFQKDESHLLLFAYTTFPSIFGMFVGSEFCLSAVKFLKSVFGNAGNSIISDAFISSFFCGAHGFYDSFFQNLSTKFQKLNKKVTFKQFFDATKDSLNNSLPYLSKFHVDAITKYSSFSQKRCTKFFVESLILKQFMRESNSSADFPSPEMNTLYINFLNELMSPIRIIYIEELLNLMITNRNYLIVNPKMSVSIWKRGIPLILNDNDLFTLYKILQKSTIFPFNYSRDDIVFSEGFRPFIIDVFPHFIKIPHDNDFLVKKLFGENPPKVEIPENDSYSRMWKKFEAYSNEHGEIISAFYLRNLNGPIFRDQDFQQYCGLQILSNFAKNFEMIEQTILLFEHFSSQKNICSLITSNNHTLYSTFSHDYFRSKIHSNSDISLTLKEFKCSVKCLPNSINFEMSCIALNYANYEYSNKMTQSILHFSYLLNKWMERQWPKQKQHCHFNKRIKYVLDASAPLGQIESVGLGKRLKIILLFQTRLCNILGKYYDQDWVILFHYALYAADSPNILSVFLTLHHFVFNDDNIVEGWGQNIHDLWSMFSAGMWYILKTDPKFCSTCSDFEECRKFFILPKNKHSGLPLM